jgi:hypothetical protein
MKTNQEKALNALLTSVSITEAAHKCELSEKMLRRYLEDADFQKEYRTARRMVFENGIIRLQSLHAGAIETLERNLSCENPSVEVKAAQIIIEASRKDFETLDILQRLEVIENDYQKQTEETANSVNQKRR